jgi:hypothetical protein
MRIRSTAVALALLAGVALAPGCGDDEETTVTETVSPPTETEATQTEATEATQTTATGPTEPTKSGPAFFSTPSGNIGCQVTGKYVRCDIRKRDWKPTPPPRPCELDYGGGIALGATHAEFICAGDTALGAPKTLGYGQTTRRGPFSCDSEPDGITCSHAGNGHGFFLSRQSFRIF